MEKILTSKALWQDFDPEQEPLDINTLKTVEKDGLLMKTLYFTGRSVSDGKTRVLAKVCSKNVKGQKPAVLLIDNYKAPIDEKELKYWANNGFVAIAIDFAGRRTKGICTLYPSSLDYCNSDVAKSYFHVGENAKQSKIYEYALNCMRAVTYLLECEKVKAVSVVTVKKGVCIGAIVLGTDKRIANGTVVFGSLYRDYPDNEATTKDQTVNQLDEASLAKHLEFEEKKQIWLSGIAPQSYAMQTKVPVYVIVSANSPHVSSSSSNKMYYRLNDDSRMLLLPTTMDYLPDDYVQSIIKWCKGLSAEEDVELEQYSDQNGDNFVKVKTKTNSSKLTLWYSRNASIRARNWVHAPLKKVEDGYIAELDVYEQSCDLIAFVSEKGQVNISTAMCEIKVTRPTRVKIPTRSVFAGNSDDNLVPLAQKGSWHGAKNHVEYCKGYLDIYGAKGKALASFAINDPCVRHNEIFTVSFDICCEVQQPLTVYVMSNFGFENTVYTQTVQLSGDGKWQRITLDGVHFHSEDRRQMPDDVQVQMLAFIANEEFIINNIFLV